MDQERTIRLLGRGMVLAGLLGTGLVLLLAQDMPVMTASLGLMMRGQFLGMAAMTLGGLWFQRCVLVTVPPAGFPLD